MSPVSREPPRSSSLDEQANVESSLRPEETRADARSGAWNAPGTGCAGAADVWSSRLLGTLGLRKPGRSGVAPRYNRRPAGLGFYPLPGLEPAPRVSIGTRP